MAVCSLFLNQEVRTESRKTLEKNVSFKSALLMPEVSMNSFHSLPQIYSSFSRHHVPSDSVAPFFSASDKQTQTTTYISSICSKAGLEKSA